MQLHLPFSSWLVENLFTYLLMKKILTTWSTAWKNKNNFFMINNFCSKKYQFLKNFRPLGHPGATIKGRPKRQIVVAHIKESREKLVVCVISKFSVVIFKIIRMSYSGIWIFSVESFIFILYRFNHAISIWSTSLNCYSFICLICHIKIRLWSKNGVMAFGGFFNTGIQYQFESLKFQSAVKSFI